MIEVDYTKHYKYFQKQIRKCLAEHKISQAKLAKLIGVKSPNTVYGYASGKTFPSVRHLLQLCKFFKKDTKWFLGE